MPKSYYQNATITKYPFQVNEILRRLVLFFANDILYKQENYQTEEAARQRFIITSANSDMGGREIIDRTKQSGWSFPFTVYVPSEITPDDTKMNEFAEGGHYYSDIVGGYVSGKCMKMETSWITFFNTQLDYYTAMKLIGRPIWTLVRLWVPIVISGTTTNFPIDLEVEMSKGEYAQDFEQWMAKGKIMDLVHNVTVSYYDYIFDEFSQEVYPVDDMLLTLRNYNNVVLESLTSRDALTLSVTPMDGSGNVSVNQPIVLTYNYPMQEETVEQAFSIFPPVFADITWDGSGTVMTYTPRDPMQSGLIYSCKVDTQIAKDIYNAKLRVPVEWEFTTI